MEPIGTTSPVLDRTGTAICIGAGPILASWIGVCAQQDLLDLHKLSLMNIAPTSVASHVADDPAPTDAVLVMTRATRMHPGTSGHYAVSSGAYRVEAPVATDAPSEILDCSATWLELPTGSRIKMMPARAARALLVDLCGRVGDVRRWIYSSAVRGCGREGLQLQPAWYTFSSTEFMCRSNVPDSCIDCLRAAVESKIVTTGVEHLGCSPESRGPLWRASVDGFGETLRAIKERPSALSTVADPFTAKLLGNFDLLKESWR